MPKLVYVRQVIDEVLRLRPAAPMVGRNAVEDAQLGGYDVAEGDVVVPFLWAAHRHPRHWPDPLCFVPERFTPAANKARHPAAYVPFSAGPRTCIGNSFSLLETTLLIAQLLNRFELEVQDCSEVRPVAMATTRPSRPVRVWLQAK